MIYDKKFKIKFINFFRTGKFSMSEIARKLDVPRQTLIRWIKSYKMFGERGLENKKSGTKEIPISPESEKLIYEMWEKRKRSAYRMRKDLKTDGINISEWQIKKIYKKYNLVY